MNGNITALFVLTLVLVHVVAMGGALSSAA
jgi:hypothetical protein